MVRYILRRLLLAIPTLLVVSLATFELSQVGSADQPINPSYEENPLGYMATVRSLGLTEPAFYCSLNSLAFPDTLHHIFPLQERKKRIDWTWQCGDWQAVCAFREAITQNLDPDLKGVKGPVLVEFKNLRNVLKIKEMPSLFQRLEASMDTLPDPAQQARLQARLSAIRQCYAALQAGGQAWKLYVPALHWHGFNNQYHRWLSSFLVGNLGKSSTTGNPVLKELRPYFLITLLLNGSAILLAYLLGVPFGVWMARHRDRFGDRWGVRVLMFLYAMPVIWIGSLLIQLFTRPDVGWGLIDGLNADPWFPDIQPFGQWLGENWEKAILPVLTLTVHTLALLAMQMRSGILGVLQKDFIRTARAKGLRETAVFWRHAFRNGLFPIITLFAAYFPAIFTGALVVESLFDFPGLGIKMQDAFSHSDYNVLFAMVMLGAVMTILVNIVVDILYAWADPRVRLSG